MGDITNSYLIEERSDPNYTIGSRAVAKTGPGFKLTAPTPDRSPHRSFLQTRLDFLTELPIGQKKAKAHTVKQNWILRPVIRRLDLGGR